MGQTDRLLEIVPKLAGNGSYRVDDCSTDHGWPARTQNQHDRAFHPACHFGECGQQIGGKRQDIDKNARSIHDLKTNDQMMRTLYIEIMGQKTNDYIKK